MKNPLLILIGNNIREVRRSKKLSQQEVGDKASLDRTYMSGVENGRRNISVLAIFQIALALDVPVENLLNGLLPSQLKGKSDLDKNLERMANPTVRQH